MKGDILKLRAEGKTYSQIQTELGCSKSTISYHCGVGQKEKNKKRHKDYKNKNKLHSKTESFKSKVKKDKVPVKGSSKKRSYDKVRDFQRRDGLDLVKLPDDAFTSKDVQTKIGNNPKCYLSGRSIDLSKPDSFCFDHIVPCSKGGLNTLDNLGVTTKDANSAKAYMELSVFLDLCVDILENNGYEVTPLK